MTFLSSLIASDRLRAAILSSLGLVAIVIAGSAGTKWG
jgi:hypothetical protein